MDKKNLWSKDIHPSLEATPITFSVMTYGVPKTFNSGKPSCLAQLVSERNFQAKDLERVHWIGSKKPSFKKAGLLILFFVNKDLAVQVEKSGVLLN